MSSRRALFKKSTTALYPKNKKLQLNTYTDSPIFIQLSFLALKPIFVDHHHSIHPLMIFATNDFTTFALSYLDF